LEFEVGEHILVVDDERGMRISLQSLLEQDGFSVSVADCALKGLKIVEEQKVDLIVCDIVMPDMSGLTFLSKLDNHIPVIIITAYASIESARSAFKSGACDYLVKPFDFEELRLLIRQYLKTEEVSSVLESSKEALLNSDNSVFKDVVKLAAKVAPTDIPVLILGESGTGKEVLANTIHNASNRASSPFIKINCAAIPEPLLESELFGYEKGAFTGAGEAKQGLFESAKDGTFLLDEIGDMPLALQSKLLRVLQNLTVVRLGGSREIGVNCRILSASNKNLGDMIASHQFREDLYYRLNGMQLKLPPLRERMEDLPRLAGYFLEYFNAKYKKNITKFDQHAFYRIQTYRWPGNIRELRNCIERAVVICEGDFIGESDLADSVVNDNKRLDEGAPTTARNFKREYMRKLLSSTLESTNGNKVQAAKILKVTRRTLYNWLSDYGTQDE
jgi:DNA-binding NtrC family response regulator